MNELPPLVSVITPSFNQGEFIGKTISSVLGQTYPHVEYLIIDGESTDETDEVVRSFIETHPQIRYVSEADDGQAHAINKGLSMANGEIVCWLNSDDYYWDEQVLTTVVDHFLKHSEVDLISGDGYAVDRDGSLLGPISLPDPRRFSLRYLKLSDFILQPATFWRRRDLRLDEALNYTFDWKFFFDLFSSGTSCLYLRHYLACYRFHDASKTIGDTAARKWEVHQMARYTGAGLGQRVWTWLVFSGFWLTERTGVGVFRTIARGANFVMKQISGGWIYSC